RVLLDAEALLDDLQLRAQARGRAVAVDLPLGRYGGEKALAVFERVGRGGEAGFGEARRDEAGMGRTPGMERLCHRAEIGHDATGLRGGERDRRGRRLWRG